MGCRAQTDIDGGWAWVVLAASVGSNYLNGALIFFVGVVHMGLLEKFEESVTLTAWVGSAYSAIMCLTVPLSTLVIEKYGCRVCSVLGGIVCFLGFVSSAFATSIFHLFFTYGTVAAVGYALSATPSYITIGYHFDKLRGLASGISVASSAIGILSGPLVMQKAMETYSLSGAFMLVGALCLHYSLFGMFFRPTVYETGSCENNHNKNCSLPLNEQNKGLILSDGKKLYSSSSFPVLSGCHEMTESRAENEGNMPFLENPQNSEDGHVIKDIDDNPKPSQDDIESMHSFKSDHIFESCKDVVDASLEEQSGFKYCGKCNCDGKPLYGLSDCIDMVKDAYTTTHCSHGGNSRYHEIILESAHGEDEQEILLNETVENDVEVQKDPSLTRKVPSCCCSECHKETGHQRKSTCYDCPDSERQAGVIIKASSSEQEKKHSFKMLSSESERERHCCSALYLLFQNKAFLCYCIGIFVACVAIMGVSLHLPEYAKSYGTSTSDAAALFVAVGIGSLVSRVCTGIATTDTAVDPRILNMGMRGLCGLATAIFPLFSGTYVGQMCYSGLFGLYTGGQIALINVLITHYVSVNLLNVGYGLLSLFMGTGYLAGPPLAALVVDNGGTYEHSFYFLGLMMLLASGMDLMAGYFASYSSQHHSSHLEIDIAV